MKSLLKQTFALFAASALLALAAAQAPVWPTLSKPLTPLKTPDADGFIQRWLLLEPIPTTGLTESSVQAAVQKDYFPNQFTVLPATATK